MKRSFENLREVTFLGGAPTILPISVFTHPGQQLLITKPGFSLANIAAMALTHAFEMA
jgi:hypothetical protein